MELLFIGSPQHVKKLTWNAVSIELLWFKAKLLIQPNSLELDPNRIFSIGTIAKPKVELNTNQWNSINCRNFFYSEKIKFRSISRNNKHQSKGWK